MFEELPSNYQYLRFSSACTTHDQVTKITTKCTSSDGFKARYLTGVIAGDSEPKDSTITFVVDVTVLKDDTKQY